MSLKSILWPMITFNWTSNCRSLSCIICWAKLVLNHGHRSCGVIRKILASAGALIDICTMHHDRTTTVLNWSSYYPSYLAIVKREWDNYKRRWKVGMCPSIKMILSNCLFQAPIFVTVIIQRRLKFWVILLEC